jgi:Flp pilus assembly protein TadD
VKPAPQTESVPKPPAEAARDAAASQAAARKLIQDEKFAEAIAQLSEAIRLDPKASRAYNARGYAHMRLKHFPEAIADFDNAIRLDPNYANAYLNRSSARRVLGDMAGANADLDKSHELSKARP